MGDETSDTELLISSADHPDSFAELYDRHASFLVGYFYRRTGCVETSADLTSETFAQAFVSRRRFRDVGAPGMAWLITIAQRQLSHYVRRQRVADKYRKKLRLPDLTLSDEDFERVEALADLPTLQRDLTEAISVLPDTQVDAIKLRIIDELSYSEIAERMGCSEGAARVRVSRGLTRLADLLEMS